MTESDALALTFARNAFYKRMHYLALAALALSIFVIGFLISVIIYLVKNPTHPLYFATDNVGKLFPIVPVTIPNMSPSDVVAWTVEAVQNSLSYDFINFHAQLQASEKYFTSFAWTNYIKAIQASNNLPALNQRKMIIIAQIADQPKLVTQGILGGAYAWKFEMPVLVTFMMPPYDDKSKFTNPQSVSVIIQRQPILQSYKGLGIVQMIASSAVTVNNQPQEISGTPTE